MNYIIKETNDFLSLSELFNESGLDVEISEEIPKDSIKLWRVEGTDTGELLAGLNIECKEGIFVLQDLAVREDMRGTGIGKELVALAEREMKKRGATTVWGCAKVPEYYYKLGWKTADATAVPDISHCQSCDQFNISCFPVIICKDI